MLSLLFLLHLYSQTVLLLLWLYLSDHMLEEYKSNSFLPTLIPFLTSSAPAVPCFLFFSSALVLPLFYVSPLLAYRCPLQQRSDQIVISVYWKVRGVRKRKCSMQPIHLYKMVSLCKMASLRPCSDPQKLLFPSTLVIPKQVLCLCGKLELQSYLIYPSLDCKMGWQWLTPKMLIFWQEHLILFIRPYQVNELKVIGFFFYGTSRPLHCTESNNHLSGSPLCTYSLISIEVKI